MENTYCAIDLGATSGRIIISSDGRTLEDVHRFSNQVYERDRMCFWDIDKLMKEIQKGLRLLANRKDLHVSGIGVDTWGVDVVYMKEGRAIAHPRAYRDPYTNGIMEDFFRVVPREVIYQKTGIQFMPFNTIFQFYACHTQHYAPFEQADKYLFMPDYVSYMLTGKMVCEYTILSTSQLLNAHTRELDVLLVEACGARMSCFPKRVMPGERIGVLKSEVADFGYDIPVIAIAGHDTASAVATVPRMYDGKHTAYLSSGTWSLMGIVSDHPLINKQSEQMNFTNEGGIEGTVRVLKNITGMWILEQCRKEWAAQGKDYSHPQLIEMAKTITEPTHLFNPDDARFANPSSMLDEVCNGHTMTDAEIVACIFHSLAYRYGEVFRMLQKLAPWEIGALYIIGGGARNTYLNQLTEKAVGVPVITGAAEATALGNIQVQMQKNKQYSI